jgi:uncharacterized RDD family membrane protein YckC
MTPESPYAPPQASLATVHRAPTLEDLATTGQRFVVFLIDSVVRGILGVPVAVVLGSAGVGLAGRLATGLAGFFVYYLVLEAALAATPGKLVTGLRVVSEDGMRATFRQILGRTLARFIPFEAFSFLGDENGRPVGWHDSLSGTRVIRAR